MQASLQEILDAREARVHTQQQLLAQYQKPLLCFTMNIPGPEKYNRDVAVGFAVGNWLLEDALQGRILYHAKYPRHTGCEAYYVTDLSARELKQIALELEDIHPIGRLFDMDVLDETGNKIDRESLGFPRRQCLICQQDAYVCAGRRTHSLAQLQERTGFLLYVCARQWFAENIAVKAYLALQQEVSTTPKPGLVDRNNRGAHTDMGMRHFFTSANALRPFFAKFAESGYLNRDLPPTEAFAPLRAIGIEAEAAMLSATGGVNTHKGAIFSLGLVCAAAGRLSPDDWSADRLLDECSAMTQGIVAQDLGNVTLENAQTAGQRIYAQYGIGGVRQQAEAGFPAVLHTGLPILKQALAQGMNLNDAGAVTLLHLLSVTDDTNLIHRSNRQTQLQIQQQIADLLNDTPFPSTAEIEKLDAEFIEKNLSPGGSADLLALCYLLLLLTQ